MRRALHDLASLAARLGVGGIFFAGGWHKLEAGLTATGEQFATLGAPAPGIWAATTMLMELVGGVLLVAGLAVPICGLLLFAEAVAVFVMASGGNAGGGLPLTGGDVSLIVALGAASILLAVGGAGRLSVDHLVVIKRREAEAAEDFAAENEANDVIAALREPESAGLAGRSSTGTVADGVPDSTPDGARDSVQDGARDTARDTAAKRPEAERPPSTAEAEAPVRPASGADPETGVDTAEFPAVRAQSQSGTPDIPRKAARAGRGDTLVAGQQDESGGR